MFKRVLLFILIGLLILPIFSEEESMNVKGTTGLFELVYPFTFEKGRAGFGLGVDNIDLQTADIDVNKFIFGLGWGLLDNLELNLNLSYNRVHMLEPGSTNFEYPFADRWQTGLGYAGLGLKYNFMKSKTDGFALMGYFNLPLSDEETAVTTGKSYYGLTLAYAHKFAKNTILAVNAGYQMNQDPDSIDIADTITYGIGFEKAIGENFSLAAQLYGKSYTGSDLAQDNPLDLMLGFKYDNEKFGIAIAYKKNLTFNNKDLEDSHGAIGTIYIKTGKTEKIPPCTKLERATIKGDKKAKAGESRSYQLIISPETATTPTITWTCSSNGTITSGQGTNSIEVKWNKEGDSWVKSTVSNPCSEVEAKLDINIIEPVLPPKKEYFFAFDSAEISEAMKKDLDIAVEYLKYHPDITIEVQGHTCSIATEEYNLALGEQRANTVKQYLIDNGISPDRIKTVSFGEEKPAYDNSQEITRKKNRRVFIPNILLKINK